MTVTRTSVVPVLKYDRTIGLLVMTGRGFQYPADVAFGRDGRIYVANRTTGSGPGVQVKVCNLDSEFFGAFGSNGSEDGQFYLMSAIVADSDGKLYISDEHLHRISVFDAEGQFLARWGNRGSAPGQLHGPSGLAFDSQDGLFVVDQRNDRVQKFSKDGTLLMGFGAHGAGEGELNRPWGVTVAPDGDVYVADWRNDRIQRFTPDGGFVASYGSPGSGEGQLYRPASVAVDENAYMYVADWGNDRLQVLDPDGGFVLSTRGDATLSVWAKEFLDANTEEAEARAKADLAPKLDYRGDTNEESSLVEGYFWGPVSVRLDGRGRLYVTDTNRHRIVIYHCV